MHASVFREALLDGPSLRLPGTRTDVGRPQTCPGLSFACQRRSAVASAYAAGRCRPGDAYITLKLRNAGTHAHTLPLRSCTCLSGRSSAACPEPPAQQPWRYRAERAHALGAPHHGRSRASVTTAAAALDTADADSTLEDDLLLDVLLPGESQRRSAPAPAAAPPVLSSKPMMPLARPTRAAAPPAKPTTTTTGTSTANPSQRQQQQPSLALPPSRPPASVPLPSPDTISPKPQRKVAKPVNPASKFPTFSDSDEVISSAYDGLAVSVSGRDPPAPMMSYNELAREPRRVSPLLLRNAAAAFRLQRPTPVQQHVIPAIMDGRDVLAVSVAGSGKTLAYLLPALASLSNRSRDGTKNSASPDVVVLVPTRELAEQVLADAQLLLRGSHLKAVAVRGGVSIAEEMMGMRGRHKGKGGGADVVIATPGRLVQLVEERRVRLGRLGLLVVDEADRMLDLGLWPDVRRLLSRQEVPTARQTVLVSSVLPEALAALADEALLKDALRVVVGGTSGVSSVVQQRFELVAREDKLSRLAALLTGQEPATQSAAVEAGDTSSSGSSGRGAAVAAVSSAPLSSVVPSVVFAHTLERAEEAARYLAGRGISVAVLHRDLTQAQRDEAMQCFRFGVTSCLVTTAIGARGLNFPDVQHVVNYDVPASASAYAHQVGRTGRGGRPGRATTFVAPQDGRAAVWLRELLQGDVKEAGKAAAVPSWLERLARRHLQQQQQEQQKGAGQGHWEGGGQAGGRQRRAGNTGKGGARGRGPPRGVRELPDLDDEGAAAAAAPSASPAFGTFLKPPPPRGAAGLGSSLSSSLDSVSSMGSLGSMGSVDAGDWVIGAAVGARVRRTSYVGPEEPLSLAAGVGPRGRAGQAGRGAAERSAVADPGHDAAEWQARFEAALQEGYRQGQEQVQQQLGQLGQLGQAQGQGREHEQAGPLGADRPPRRKAGRGPRRAAGASLPVVLEAGDVVLEAGGQGGLSAGFARS